ncbi:MAG: reactive intermediate/imine deaminase [Zhongshania marina]|jgi:reactive intermediate/imine deaminase|uniref:Reactive intermediate/imine deaminase n=1 Tax=Zhongshania marina TaxID=2304603 RepID=A0A2S4HKP5_9GAMM|nr:RidA family protein [Marortus luteolus]POP54572.1 reactive intermediate/imine deaminase [Marortus luteolus]RNL59532.1 RidA family protein [Zhongshania marina]|tara:strand:+ start:169 stop:552 length:384 start_codon:yes stop_codon:yes gene_type:complete
MSNKEIISTNNAPQAIGTYSQAVKVGSTVYLSGQIPLIPETMEMIEGGIKEQATQVFKNLSAVAEAAGGSLNDAAKVNISLIDLGVFAQVNEVMAQFFAEPYPARACVQVAALPRGAMIEVEVILAL